METKFFIDPDGNYLGGFCGAKPPEGSIEIPEPPKHARHKWDFESKSFIETDERGFLEKLSDIYEALPFEAQADFATLRTAVKMELELGRPAIAKAIIERASVPPQLESLRQQMVELFN